MLFRSRWAKLGKEGGYSVSSAEMKAGSALLFGPTIVHGGAIRSDTTSPIRFSLDVRFVAKPTEAQCVAAAATPPAAPDVQS